MDEIHKQSSQGSCPGQYNPADVPSQSCSAKELSTRELCWNGPKILKMTKNEWPNLPKTYENKAADLELAKNAPMVVHSLVLIADKE